jgi:hypothetical protein
LFLYGYRDKKKRPRKQCDNRRSDDPIEDCSKKSAQMTSGAQRRSVQRASRHSAAHHCMPMPETSIQKTDELSRSFFDARAAPVACPRLPTEARVYADLRCCSIGHSQRQFEHFNTSTRRSPLTVTCRVIHVPATQFGQRCHPLVMGALHSISADTTRSPCRGEFGSVCGRSV